jgi:hypothetical protein
MHAHDHRASARPAHLGGWRHRLGHGRLGFGANPLRRRADRIESAVALTAVLLFLAVVALTPVLGIGLYHHSQHDEHARAATRHHVTATIVSLGKATSYAVEARVQWREPDRTTRTASVTSGLGSSPGDPVPMWVDASGHQLPQPQSTLQIAGGTVLTVVSMICAAGLLLWLTYLAVRIRLNRCRLADWDAEWRQIGPRWSQLT